MVDPILGIMKRCFNIARSGIFFCNIAHSSKEIDQTFIFLDKEVSIKFRKSSGFGLQIRIRGPGLNLDSGSGPNSPWLRSVLAECSVLWNEYVNHT